MFVCQLTGPILIWRVDLPERNIEQTKLSPQAGTNLTFENDDDFGFEIHILSSSSAGIMSELRVTAVSQLNGITVECARPSGSFMSTIQVVSVGECVKYVTVRNI